MRRRVRTLLSAALAIGAVGPAAAQYSDGKVKIGVMSDMSGVYSDITGKGSTVAAQMAVDDCLQAECKGMKIEIVSADHQNKPDVGLAIARSWIDQEGVDAMTDLANASLQLALPTLLKEKNRIGLFPSGTARLTGDACMPSHIVNWMWDTYVQVAGVTNALTKPGTKWYLVTADYAFGAQMEADAKVLAAAKGGSVIGSSRHPFPATDLSSQMLAAQGSGADFVALANAGGDTINGIKAAREFGISQSRQQLAAFFMTVMDVRSVGLDAAQGMLLTEGFYWDQDERARRFSQRFKGLHGAMPSTNQAGVYSVVRHYLKAVAAAGTDEAGAVMAKMHEVPVDDDVMRNGRLRPDGRMVHDFYLFRVKKPADSKGEWDYYDTVATIPGDEAFRPLSQSTCPAIRK